MASRIIRDLAGVTSGSTKRAGFAFAHTAPYRKFGFTLAEVLITLGIIGVVAALLIPGINDKIERHRNAVVLKRAYADLQNYIKMLDYEYDCGQDFNNCFPNEQELRFKLTDYLIEKQNFRSLNQDSTGYKMTNTLAAYTCSAVSVDNSSMYCLISPTGEYAYFIGRLGHDNFYGLSYANHEYYRATIDIVTDAKKLKICKWICNGVNDYSKAKIYEGRNIFRALLTNKRVFPNGSDIGAGGSRYYWTLLTDDTCSKEKGKYTACFQKVINDGWQIKYPY